MGVSGKINGSVNPCFDKSYYLLGGMVIITNWSRWVEHCLVSESLLLGQTVALWRRFCGMKFFSDCDMEISGKFWVMNECR